MNNEECSDSLVYEIDVDNTRRVYFPNIFSPDGDGNNDVLYFQSPDPGTIESFRVYDRWGNLHYETEDMLMNDLESGWEPPFDFESGAYTWVCEITFLDELTEFFTGVVFIAK